MMSGSEIALLHISKLKQETEHDVSRRIMSVGKDLVMRPVTYREEMERKLKNSISWCQRHRREAQKSIEYFLTQDDGSKFITGFEQEIEELNEQEVAYKAALSQVRSS
jgi:hypothetical protein